MEGYPGFPDGNLKVTPLPEPFFRDLLPLIDNLAELKLTLHCLWLFRQPGREAPYVTAEELEADELLGRSLLAAAPDPHAQGRYRTREALARDTLHKAIELAVARGTLIQVSAEGPQGGRRAWFFLNSEQGRAAVERVQRGEWAPPGAEQGQQLAARRPNIYLLYEQNVGLIHSPLLAQELQEAEETYPADWIEEAFRIAVRNNVRRWAYVRGILERWAQEGRGPQPGNRTPAREERPSYRTTDYGNLIKE